MIRNFIKFSIQKASLNHILFLLLLVMAIFSYQKIPKEIFPPASLDKVVIRGGYVGASGDILDKMAVMPLEDRLKSVENISNIESVIQNGSFSIMADIKDGADKNLILNDIKDIITILKKDLPQDMDEPTAKILIKNFPLMLIAISGSNNKAELLKVAKKLKEKLSKFKDLSSIDIRGDADFEIAIEFDSKKLEALNIPKSLFYQAVSNLSSIYPIGTFKTKKGILFISSKNDKSKIKELLEAKIKISNIYIRLKDVAKIEYKLSDPREISHFNGKPNISLNITKSKNGNAIYLSRQIKKLLKEFQKEYPSLQFKVYTDTSLWIRNRINLVSSNLFFGLILVSIALFLSLNWKISLVVAIGIPTSFFIALIGADMIGYSMNMLTMLGALIALGMLVDEAIVVAENIYRHLEMGKDPTQAAIDGAVEMFPAVLTATSTTIFAFLPLLIMSGEIGVFMRVLPVMISILLLSSLFEAFFFLPLHAKELFSIKSSIKEKPSLFWENIKSKYEKFLIKILHYKKSILALLVSAILGGTYILFKANSFELFPPFDAMQIYISGKLDVNNKLKDSEKLMEPIEKELLTKLNKNEISSITSIVGIKFNADNSFESGEHLFHIFINLHERKPQNFFDKYINPILSLEYDDSDMKRERSSQEILKEIRTILKKFKNDNRYKELFAYVPQTGIVKNDIEIGFSDSNFTKVKEAIKKIKIALKNIKGVKDIEDNIKYGPIELKFRVNEYGYNLGISEKYLSNILRGALLDGEYGKSFNEEGLIYIRLKDINKDKEFKVKNVQIELPNSNGFVRLKDIVTITPQKNFLKIYKEDGKRVWSVKAAVDRKIIVPSEVMKKIKPILQKIKKEGVQVIIKGEEKANKQVILESLEAAIIAIFLIFIALLWMFNSIKLALITLSVIPLSLFGALLGTKLMGLKLTMPGIMGIVGLAGVVVNDALIMLDFIKDKKSIKEVAKGASLRLRPILLTSITTILGLFTLIFFASGQSLIIQPMAVSLGFGIAWATILNLIYIPLLFSTVYRVK
ncbi:MAG: efflux RND transporter permease subunit [Epsilonproteobacteria bacterium]|nr:efflux RND transporter permease subunit [Campylobacterota bacterium]